MKNKIIVSLLLIFLIAISASAVSASEDLSDTIEMTSDSPDIELGAVDEEAVSEVNNDINEYNYEEIEDNDKLGGADIYQGGNTIPIKTTDDLSKYLEDRGQTHYSDGTTYYLDNYTFNLTSSINIKKSYCINGGIIKAEGLDYFFNIESPSNKGPNNVIIKNTKFIITKNQSVISAKGQNEGINNVLNIAGVTLENITLEIADSLDPTKVTLLSINQYPMTNTFSNEINIFNNHLNGACSLNLVGTKLFDEIYIDATEINYMKDTKILSTDIFMQYLVDKDVNDSPFPFQVRLQDESGKNLSNKTVCFFFSYGELAGKEFSAVTDSNGIATLKISITKAQKTIINSYFKGDEEYRPCGYYPNNITTYMKDSTLILKNVAYKVTATKKLSATLKSPVYTFKFTAQGFSRVITGYKLLKNKKVTFTVNGKKYTAITNSKGIATVKITLNKKGKYDYFVNFTGDAKYNAVTKKGKLTINPLATSLATKKYTFKKAAKTKKISVTLKSGKTALKSQKITLKVNGKTYTAKTNSKGIATVKIALNKKGTFKYSVKYAGNNKYKAVSKTNKVIIK